MIFPSMWELILPNFTIWTLFGIIMLILGMLVLQGSNVTRLLGLKTAKYGSMLVWAGLFFIWGISILQDFFGSTGGQLILWGSIITVIVALVLFYEPKRRKR